MISTHLIEGDIANALKILSGHAYSPAHGIISSLHAQRAIRCLESNHYTQGEISRSTPMDRDMVGKIQEQGNNEVFYIVK